MSELASESVNSEQTLAGAPSGTRGGHGGETATQAHDPEYPQRLRDFMHTGWQEPATESSPRPEAAHYANRRAQLSAAFPGETLVIPTGSEKVRANDTAYVFRPGSDFVWLTGEHDPDSVLVIRPGGATLYVRPRSSRDTDEFFTDRAYGELWIGRRQTLAEKATALGLDTAPLAELERALGDCAPARTRVLRGLDLGVDRAVRPYDHGARDDELASTISELKLVKDEWEIAQLQDAIAITVRGFEDVARVLPADRPVSERLVEGVFGLRARHDGNGVGYNSIVGSGGHATILHWQRNDGTIAPGDLLLADMGAENRNLYTADVTRTFPVSGTFSSAQRQVYDIVYAAQQAGLSAIKPGAAFEEVARTVNQVLAAGLAELGVLPVSVDEALDSDVMLYRRWSLHGFGHMLGIDVHDCSRARKERYREGALGEGYVLTMEPGLYFQPDDDLVPAEFRGIGVRIEDDVLVTAAGAVNLSAALPRTPDEVETWLATQRTLPPSWA